MEVVYCRRTKTEAYKNAFFLDCAPLTGESCIAVFVLLPLLLLHLVFFPLLSLISFT
jgi:hypothetical protein